MPFGHHTHVLVQEGGKLFDMEGRANGASIECIMEGGTLSYRLDGRQYGALGGFPQEARLRPWVRFRSSARVSISVAERGDQQ